MYHNCISAAQDPRNILLVPADSAHMLAASRVLTANSQSAVATPDTLNSVITGALMAQGLKDMFEGFSKEKRKEIRDLNGAVKRARHKRKTYAPLPRPPAIPQMQPRSNNVRNKKQKAAASAITRQGLLDTMEELDNMNNVIEDGTEEEIPAVTPRRSQRHVAFNIASKRG